MNYSDAGLTADRCRCSQCYVLKMLLRFRHLSVSAKLQSVCHQEMHLDDERPDMIMLAGIVTFLAVSGSVVFFLFAAFIGPEKMAEAWDLNQDFGLVAARHKDWPKAEKKFRDALLCAERASSVERIGESRFALGVSLQMQNRRREARTEVERALALFNSLDDGKGPLIAGGDPIAAKQIKCLLSLAEMDLEEGRDSSALRWLNTAFEIRKKRFVPLDLGFRLRAVLARILRKQGKLAQAQEIENQLPENVKLDPL